ncbi:MAG: hypothetical protein D6805_05230 [Planctomycetota bacterium]|nr:MAG: hypothetical protein D6805_05230 [Planctomycetota bacterium]
MDGGYFFSSSSGRKFDKVLENLENKKSFYGFYESSSAVFTSPFWVAFFIHIVTAGVVLLCVRVGVKFFSKKLLIFSLVNFLRMGMVLAGMLLGIFCLSLPYEELLLWGLFWYFIFLFVETYFFLIYLKPLKTQQ